MTRHVFTVDVEDWYQGIPISDRESARFEPRLEGCCHRLLDLMAEFGVRGTFFILGPVARDYPDLIRRIANEGHELGCHGWSHDLIYEMTPERFRAETQRACDAIGHLLESAVDALRQFESHRSPITPIIDRFFFWYPGRDCSVHAKARTGSFGAMNFAFRISHCL